MQVSGKTPNFAVQMNETYEQLFGLLRTAFGIETASDKPLTEQQWLRLYQCAMQQSLTGVVYQSLSLQRPLRIKYRRLSLMPDRQYVCKM